MATKVISFLKDYERSPRLMSCFAADTSSSWVAIKNLLLSSTLEDVHEEYSHKKELFSPIGMYFILKSLKNYIRALWGVQRRDIFFGASSGLFWHQGAVWDSYFPYRKLSASHVIYCLNSTNFPHLRSVEEFLDKNQTIMENFLIGPWKVILGRLETEVALWRGNSGLDEAFQEISKNFQITRRQIFYAHYKFLWGKRLFKLFLRPLRLKDAYVVSAYTKSDICAALKDLGVRVFEIQHGFLGPSHIGYNYAAKVSGLPVPDRVLVYNEFWKRELQSAGYFTVDQIEVIGRLKYDLAQDRDDLKTKRYLIFTGQGGFYAPLTQFLLSADKELAHARIHLLYKSHPRELSQDLEKLRKDIGLCQNVSVYEGPETTETLIRNSLGHISVFSSCHFDAIHYLGKTFILDVMKDNVMKEYVVRYPSQYREVQSIQDILKEIS